MTMLASLPVVRTDTRFVRRHAVVRPGVGTVVYPGMYSTWDRRPPGTVLPPAPPDGGAITAAPPATGGWADILAGLDPSIYQVQTRPRYTPERVDISPEDMARAQARAAAVAAQAALAAGGGAQASAAAYQAYLQGLCAPAVPGHPQRCSTGMPYDQWAAQQLARAGAIAQPITMPVAPPPAILAVPDASTADMQIAPAAPAKAGGLGKPVLLAGAAFVAAKIMGVL